jgi:hypothetical protein
VKLDTVLATAVAIIAALVKLIPHRSRRAAACGLDRERLLVSRATSARRP